MPTPPVDPAELRALFSKALDLSPEQQAQLLDRPDLSPGLRDELRAMLIEDQRSETFLRNTVESGRPVATAAGEHFGVYETRELLGRGGMGAVYKAERDDGEIVQTVAIKVIERGWLSPGALERFRQERQFLARLVHPNIARLIDGGTREDGVPYLVMEYVDGLPLDKFCAQRKLAIADRLRLILPLCAAVDSAHQQLIVHRDLKPSNVLVTAAGEPKLLDFGIAKAIDSAASGATQTIVLTPDFASPEQARGEQPTTATDVYGLGAVLYFLLTQSAPRRAGRDARIALPSSFNPELKGDLENILLKALHDEPQRRYHSARELGEDVERYLEHRPVRATPDGWSYRANRFIRRHTAACVAAALALIAIVGGAAVSMFEAHRAQQRFAQVRDLANRFVFDFEASIRDTPGTLAARRMVASTAREYLSKLAEDAGRDASLNRELAQSYYRLSRIEISSGESAAALEHLAKSVEIHEKIKDDCCGPPAERDRYLEVLTSLARYHFDARSQSEAVRVSEKALKTARAWLAETPDDPLAAKALVTALSTSGSILNGIGKSADARDRFQEAVDRATVLYQKDPVNDDLGFVRATAGYRLANLLHVMGDSQTALDQEKHAKTVLDGMLERHPENIRWRNLRIYMLDNMGDFLGVLARQDPSLKPSILDAFQEAFRLARSDAEQSPGDKDALSAAQFAATRLSNQLVRENRMDEALPILHQSTLITGRLAREDPANRRNRYLFSHDLQLEGNYLMHANRWREAAQALGNAEQFTTTALQQWPSDLELSTIMAIIVIDQTTTERMLGHVSAARARCEIAEKLAEDLIARNKDAKRLGLDLEALRTEARTLGVRDRTAVAH